MTKEVDKGKNNNFKLITIKLKGIIECIRDYSSEAKISIICNELINALFDNDIPTVKFLCEEIKKWYDANIYAILNNEYVFNKESHRDNMLLIKEIIDNLNNWNLANNTNEISYNDSYNNIINIFNKFHEIVVELKNRHDNRQTLIVEDEYDVQDLLHALLHLYFEDIRVEEWTPSCCGTSSRQDFLLHNENIVIETKMTRTGLNNKELANELIIDIERYKKHPNCKTLYCFVYDPINKIKNPRGFEKDLTKNTDGLQVIVIIKP